MIADVLEFLKDQLNVYALAKLPINSDDRVAISNLVQQEQQQGSLSDLIDNRILLSLIHVEKETAIHDQRNTKMMQNGSLVFREPPLYLNIYISLTSHFDHYLTGIRNLSATLAFFQSKHVFDASEYPSLNPAIERLIVELHTFSLDQQFQFWQSMGGKFLPSVMYKIRMITLEENAIDGTGSPIQSATISGAHMS